MATIGAPADPAHVTHLRAESRAETERRGEAEVCLAGCYAFASGSNGLPGEGGEVAPLAGEWIHQAAVVIRARIPLTKLLDGIAQFPPTVRDTSTCSNP